MVYFNNLFFLYKDEFIDIFCPLKIGIVPNEDDKLIFVLF